MSPFELQCEALQATVDCRRDACRRMVALLRDNGTCAPENIAAYIAAAKLHYDAERIADNWRPKVGS